MRMSDVTVLRGTPYTGVLGVYLIFSSWADTGSDQVRWRRLVPVSMVFRFNAHIDDIESQSVYLLLLWRR